MTEAELILECKRFNKDAQKELYLKYAPCLKVVCQRYGGSYYAPADLLQDGFIKIFSNIKQYKGEGSFEGWMRRIIVNTAISFYRKKVKEPGFVELGPQGNFADDEHDDQESSFDMLQDKITREEVIQTMNQMPEPLRFVLNLYIFENYSHKEIADELSITIQNSKVRLMRARQLLQQMLIELVNSKTPDNKIKIGNIIHTSTYQNVI